jgi:hypothetical protein
MRDGLNINMNIEKTESVERLSEEEKIWTLAF